MVTDKLAHSIWSSISNRMHLQARRRGLCRWLALDDLGQQIPYPLCKWNCRRNSVTYVGMLCRYLSFPCGNLLLWVCIWHEGKMHIITLLLLLSWIPSIANATSPHHNILWNVSSMISEQTIIRLSFTWIELFQIDYPFLMDIRR